MGYLPTFVEEIVINDKKEEKYRDFYFDEKTNSFNGIVVDGIEALKGWIYFALKIARYRYPIYSWKYGCELENFINKTFDDEDYVQSETKRYVEDALLINPYIKKVDDVVVTKDKEKLNVSCKVETKYGDLYVSI